MPKIFVHICSIIFGHLQFFFFIFKIVLSYILAIEKATKDKTHSSLVFLSMDILLIQLEGITMFKMSNLHGPSDD